MGRQRPPKQSAQSKALQKIQLASARERLKLETAKARAAEDQIREAEGEVNQFGRPIVSYEDMPELSEADQALLHIEFERLACPHWAVAKYRPGFGPKNELRKLSRDSWYFYETGQKILSALFKVLLEERVPNLVEALSTETLDMASEMEGLATYLLLEKEATMEAAILHRTTTEKMAVKNEVERAKIRESLERRYSAIHKRNHERDNRPV